MIRQTTVFRLIAVINFLIIAAGAQSLFSATAGFDANAVSRLAAEGRFDEGSYGMTALIYAYLPGPMRELAVYIVGAGFILYSTRRLQTNAHALAITFLALAPSILTVAGFQKDLLLVPFIICAAISIERTKSLGGMIALVAVIYGLYGYWFRDYYFLILFFFIFLLVVARLPSQWKVLLGMGLLIIIMITPLSVLQALQGPRDSVNYLRLSDPNFVGARSAFANLLPIESAWAFVVNYFYALIRLNFAFFINPGAREAFLELNLIFYAFAIVTAFRHGSRRARTAATLILAHLIVLTFFEPDLGSYIRHLSSTLPFAAIPLVEYFSRRRWRLTFGQQDHIGGKNSSKTGDPRSVDPSKSIRA